MTFEHLETTAVATKFRNILRYLELQDKGTPTLIVGDYCVVAAVVSPPTVTAATAIDKTPSSPENTDVDADDG